MSVAIQTPDGSSRVFENAPSGVEFAKSISTSLAKKALALRVNGELKDVSTTLNDGETVEIITLQNEEEALELVRHDCAHILAQAVKELFPETQVTIGPVIKNGFYYDFYRETPFTADDLPTIEKRMRQIVKKNVPLVREEWPRNEAIAFFKDQGELFKAELIEDLPEDTVISVYKQGDFLDLCRGPHMPSTGKTGQAFKLTHVAGAYWRGDSEREQLQRIYGTAWRTEEELKAYLTMIEEAEKRDHRKLGPAMELFKIQEEAVGNVFWHPRGWRMYRRLEAFIAEAMENAGYEEVSTPQLVDRMLWEKSGHWGKYQENMFTTSDADGDRIYALKPMNCPGAVQIYKAKVRSYRDLPIRYSELNALHRNEPSGSLHGLMRLRSFRQDDAHIFCREDQVLDETRAFIDFLMKLYSAFGFEDIRIKFSDRPAKRIGDDSTWDAAEASLKDACDQLGLDYTLNPGEGAFYGPKLEFVLRDAIGRDWQCGTLQVDFLLPSEERLDCVYTGEDNSEHRPVLLHRAALGSLERFLGILIESTAGHLPTWLSPVPVVIATVTNRVDAYAESILQQLKAAGVYAELDLRNEKIGYKVRDHSSKKTPYIWVLGDQEAENQQVTVRTLGSRQTEAKGLQEAIDALVAERHFPEM